MHLLAHLRTRARRALQSTAGRSTRGPLDDKTLPWAVFAQHCVGSSSCEGAVTQADVTALAQSLTHHTPYVISCSAIHVEVRANKTSWHCHYDENRNNFLLMHETTISMVSRACWQVLHSGVPATELSHALQGSIVGLLAQRAAEPSAAADGTLPAACLGLGLIRTLDTERGLLYLLTPLPLDQLQRVNSLQVRPFDVGVSDANAPSTACLGSSLR